MMADTDALVRYALPQGKREYVRMLNVCGLWSKRLASQVMLDMRCGNGEHSCRVHHLVLDQESDHVTQHISDPVFICSLLHQSSPLNAFVQIGANPLTNA